MQIPSETRQFILENPQASGFQIWRSGFATSPRTGRRWKKMLLDYPDKEQHVTSEKMEAWEENDTEFDLEEFLAWAPRQVELADKEDPIITHDVLNFHTNQPVAVIFPSCAHLGGRFTAYATFREILLRVLKMDRVYWGSLGDDIEGFYEQFRDVKAVSDQLVNVSRQYQVLEAVLKKLSERDKLLFGVSSQHGGEWTRRRNGTNPVKEMYLSFGVPFFDGAGYVKFLIGDQVYNIAFAHQFKGHSMYNPSHPQARALRYRYPNADVVIMGDRHSPAVQQFPAFTDEVEAGNRADAMITLLQSGTAKTGPDYYTISGWEKGRMGWPICVFYPDEHKVKFSWDLEDVEMWLNG